MAGYNEIRGLRVKYLSDDPSGAEDGQVWYNSATGTLRVQGIGVAAWSSSNDAVTARDTAASTGPQTSALVFGGATPSRTTATEEYDGIGWASGGVLPTATTGMGSARNASQTAALGMGGYDGAKTGATFKYDGTSWTAAGTMGTPRQLYMVGGGTQTAAITFGGDTYPPAPSRNTTATEEYDGSSWTAANSLGTGGYSGAGTGPQSAAVRMGAPSTSNNTVTENFDGTNWTASGTIPISKSAMLAAGTQTASILFGGIPAPLSTTALEYDGSTYSAIPSPAISKYNNAGGGSSSAAFMSHGRTPAPAFVTTTEEYNFSASTITAAAWASGGNLNTARSYVTGAGQSTLTAGLVFGGGPGGKTETEEYNGTSWSESGDLATGRNYIAGGGTQTAAFGAGGYNSGGTGVNNGEEYNGTSWSETNDLNTARGQTNGFGSQTAGVCAGGNAGSPSRSNAVEEYDGTNWTSVTGIPAGTGGAGACGTLTAGLYVGGITSPSPPSSRSVTAVYEYDGTNWTSGGALPVGKSELGVYGTQTNAMGAGGYTHSPAAYVNTTQKYDGSAWANYPNMATGRGGMAGAGTVDASGGFFAGGTPGGVNITEEFVAADTETITASTLTTS